ncbi:hypothetical protein ACRE_087220 [Hapsidospora chrysogenum ATCC 11550]|uniref:Uncharacterized protein n=1 Tax=Hapsidospora chrysogenum (strain ATCC 11550 / CBS 779.69 / DSM 880 / IAM 14645 / JCM 23072 / IMI 49137) TaxID=857340 RepID=A0A086SU02_HAPC1|nr:hypothetical protein ACRE_087220 [Hapsidospora chrysogenum ATCC 11550]
MWVRDAACAELQYDRALLPPDSYVRQIHDAGHASAVFCFGDAIMILKVRLADEGKRREQ